MAEDLLPLRHQRIRLDDILDQGRVFVDVHAEGEGHKVSLEYSDDAGRMSQCIILPLGLTFFAPVWLLVAWCEKRDDFRNFRVDRMISADRLNDIYPEAQVTDLLIS